MTRWWRWTLSLLLCGVGAVALVPGPPADAAPAPAVGFGSVIADLGTVPVLLEEPGFSDDGAYCAPTASARAGDRTSSLN